VIRYDHNHIEAAVKHRSQENSVSTEQPSAGNVPGLGAPSPSSARRLSIFMRRGGDAAMGNSCEVAMSLLVVREDPLWLPQR